MRRVPEQARSQAEPSCERKQIQKTKMLRVDGRSRISLLLHLDAAAAMKGMSHTVAKEQHFRLLPMCLSQRNNRTLSDTPPGNLVLRLFLGRRSTA